MMGQRRLLCLGPSLVSAQTITCRVWLLANRQQISKSACGVWRYRPPRVGWLPANARPRSALSSQSSPWIKVINYV